MPIPPITLLTDFGTDDGYVAQMKGVILGIAPEATIVDVTHTIPPGDIQSAAIVLDRVVDAFPQATIHVVVVDPGVGSERSVVGVEAAGQRFLAPDNGLLTNVLLRYAPSRACRLTADRFWRNPVSSTFHGRDILAPVAAWWSRGADLSDFGPPLESRELVRLEFASPTRDGRSWIGEVVSVDRFGNLITNLSAEAIGDSGRESVEVTIGSTIIRGIGRYYAEQPAKSVMALIGSSGQIEVAVNGGHAAEHLEAGVGAVVRIASVERS